MSYPNGVEVDANDWVYVAENSAARVRMVHAYTGEQHMVANGLVQPNGVILSPDQQTLYVGSFGGGIIYAVDRISTTEWAPHRVLYNPPGGDGGFDGINVDSCGNVYITEYIRGDVYRIAPDGSRARQIASLPSSWIPNMRWGVGVGGWDADILYVADRNQGLPHDRIGSCSSPAATGSNARSAAAGPRRCGSPATRRTGSIVR
jgi:sugar lactone lactonase YvrE